MMKILKCFGKSNNLAGISAETHLITNKDWHLVNKSFQNAFQKSCYKNILAFLFSLSKEKETYRCVDFLCVPLNTRWSFWNAI